MIPFKVFLGGLVACTGVGWIISGAVQKPPAKTLKDFVKLSSDGSCIVSFNPDRDGFAPQINCSAGEGQCCKAPGK